MNQEKIIKLNDTIISASKKIKVLSALSWPAEAEEHFLNDWYKGNIRLPKIKLEAKNVSESIDALDGVIKLCDLQHPVEKFLAETARSYANAGRMLMNVGTPEFTTYSIKLYGRPDMVYQLQGISAVDGAKFFLDLTEKLLGNPNIDPVETDISAEKFVKWLKREVDVFFTKDKIEVRTDDKLSSKAIAGATRIRIRANAVFSQLDKDQLLCHEAFVHTATQLNGRKQLNLTTLGLGAPRTTRTQEGIAVFAELITNAIDLSRLRRIALRVIAVQMALDGADFIDLFKFFLDAGQSETESVKSAQRIFRGGDVKNKLVFTKDGVYLQGLLEVHTMLRIAIRDNKPELVSNLFAGRMTIADTIRLNEYFEKGWLIPPVYMPTWAKDLRRLAAMLAFSAFISNINLDVVTLDRFLMLDEAIMTSGD